MRRTLVLALFAKFDSCRAGLEARASALRERRRAVGWLTLAVIVICRCELSALAGNPGISPAIKFELGKVAEALFYLVIGRPP
jgi:hypothetical protein